MNQQTSATECLVKFEFNMEFHWDNLTSYSDSQKVFFLISLNILQNLVLKKKIIPV